jgi:hypothetical protein
LNEAGENTMSHRTFRTTVRILAVVFVAAIAVGAVVRAGSQEVPPPEEGLSHPSLLNGTVVLHFTAESDGRKVLDVELRCAHPKFHLSPGTCTVEGARFDWELAGFVDVLSGGGSIIHLDVQRLTLNRREAGPSLDMTAHVGAVLATGQEKVLFRSDDVTLRVKAVFEPAGS